MIRYHDGKFDPNTGQIFVFGSNLLGHHDGGAAKYALEHCGALQGYGQGLVGNSYALPTCAVPGIALTNKGVQYAIELFMAYACIRADLQFFVTAVGCGIAGFTHEEIATMFSSGWWLPNITFPSEWKPYLDPLWP